jgi:hypothetical protein
MRLTRRSLAAAGVVLLRLASVSAQTSTGAVTFTNVVRDSSPRAPERPSGILTRDEQLGLRDCPCEHWTFEGAITPTANTRSLEWWIGTTATSCQTGVNRFPANNATCWPLERLGINATLPINGNRFSFRIPARWLVDPINGTCTPPSQVSAGSNVYLTGLLRPPDDNVPSGALPITVSTTRPQTVQTVTASSAESSAIIEWQHLGSTDDGGTAQTPANTAGYYVLCLPRPAGYDAGTSGANCDSSTAANSDGTSGDASDDVVQDTGVVTDSGVAFSCSSAALPADFEPNDDSHLAQYACSGLLGVGSNRFTVSGLVNGESYRFAVIAQDNAGNRSLASSLTPCVTPEEVTDFWERYERSAGTNAARPGVCSVRLVAQSTGGPNMWLAGALVVVLARRLRLQRTAEKNGVRS